MHSVLGVNAWKTNIIVIRSTLQGSVILLQDVASYELHVVPVFVVRGDMQQSNPVCYLSVHHSACRENRHKNFSSCARGNSTNALVSFCRSWISSVKSSRNEYLLCIAWDVSFYCEGYFLLNWCLSKLVGWVIKVLSPTDAQENCFKRSIKIYIKTAPTCFDVITIIRERTIWAF